jgi:hypothetical protein
VFALSELCKSKIETDSLEIIFKGATRRKSSADSRPPSTPQKRGLSSQILADSPRKAIKIHLHQSSSKPTVNNDRTFLQVSSPDASVTSPQTLRLVNIDIQDDFEKDLVSWITIVKETRPKGTLGSLRGPQRKRIDDSVFEFLEEKGFPNEIIDRCRLFEGRKLPKEVAAVPIQYMDEFNTWLGNLHLETF